MSTKKNTHKPNTPAARSPTLPKLLLTLLFLLCSPSAPALQPDQILIIANSQVAESINLARYYCRRRAVPADNILSIPLGPTLADTISRDSYNIRLVAPLRAKLSENHFAGRIKCLLTTFGVPIKVTGRGPLADQTNKLPELTTLIEQTKQASADPNLPPDRRKQNDLLIRQLQSEVDRILGRETDAAVDSELSLVLLGDYELYRWQQNKLKKSGLLFSYGTLMVSRLDGPDFNIARNLVDKALIAESNGLRGIAYIDTGYKLAKSPNSHYNFFDKTLLNLADIIRLNTFFPVEVEQTENLFAPGQCPQTAIYCGWYSLQKYIDAFDFVNGAIGYHIASLEAVNLRDPNSAQWCPAMLKHGVTATIGAVAEPYLQAFPRPDEFFAELFDGSCLVEAYYATLPFNSWRVILIGDPLYTPFKKH